ncbi:hypothetical protein GCM10010193_65360 [Kitasatospora atroaurantiaca]|uniref:Uncharacterized protein n=1 Tax=Kitasatospora atroaurantiaca TaxID=285545 RepID=A0A561EMI1_9ACTN|nr:hypothetical protein [Kitasatospora atroaurantiaca]TWE16831.1 hypothetical protein FB465_1823 [Kitasatospora atroaurantiaca]
MAARRYCFVLALFGGLLVLSLPLYLAPESACLVDCGVGVRSPGGVLGVLQLTRPGWLEVYWSAALVAAGWAVLRRYRRAGARWRAVPCVAVAWLTGALTTWLTVTGWTGFHSPSAVLGTAQLLRFNGATPLVVSALALLALAAAERSTVLLAVGVAYAGVAYVAATYDSLYVLDRLGLDVDVISDPWGVRQLLNIAIPAVLLLVAGGVARIAGRGTGASPAGAPRHRKA